MDLRSSAPLEKNCGVFTLDKGTTTHLDRMGIPNLVMVTLLPNKLAYEQTKTTILFLSSH